MQIDARLLGSGGWMPTDARETCCFFVRRGNRALVVDAGTGFRRLVTEPQLLEGVQRLDIVLTHFHLDHIVGLSYLPGIDVPVEVWAPGLAVARTPALELVHRLLDPPFLLKASDELEGLPERVHELAPPGAQIGPFHIDVRIQPQHPSPTLALKLDGVLAYCTDTAYDDENVEFVRGARVLLHESFHAADTTDDRGHTAAGEAARLAAAAGVERLVLIHPSPKLDGDGQLLAFARAEFPASEIGRDGLVVAT
jgi:ribonuclease BN (tRNA processing enzyme)